MLECSSRGILNRRLASSIPLDRFLRSFLRALLRAILWALDRDLVLCLLLLLPLDMSSS
jgi:hypothetical protein